MKIAIDGPAGAGKSTIAEILSRKLGFTYIDTGAMYRALTYKALQLGIAPDNRIGIIELARNLDIQFITNEYEQRVLCDHEDVNECIRSPQVSAVVSKVASYTEVRQIMVKRQQEMASAISVVMDGRDIGECVLPDAEFKFFLTASLAERVRRRAEELTGKGFEVAPDLLEMEMAERDFQDSVRDTGALKILNDAIVIDTTGLSVNEVTDEILQVIRESRDAV